MILVNNQTTNSLTTGPLVSATFKYNNGALVVCAGIPEEKFAPIKLRGTASYQEVQPWVTSGNPPTAAQALGEEGRTTDTPSVLYSASGKVLGLVDDNGNILEAITARTTAQLAGAPTADDIACGDSVVFYDTANPALRYVMNLTRTAFVSIASSGSGPTDFIAPLKVGYAGDSIALQYANNNGLSPLWWLATELYNCEYVNHFVSAVGGTSSSHLMSVQLAQLQALAVKPDLLIVQSLQNDYTGTAANADLYAGYVTAYVTAALAAGVKFVAVCGHPPKSSTPDVAQAVLRMNKILDNYCRNTPGTYYIDTVNVWRAPPTAAETGINWKGTANTSNAFSDDGTHPMPLAIRALAPAFLPLMQRYARPVSILPAVAQNYDDTLWPYNNLLGLDGLMIGTNGQYNAVNNANVAGSAATTYARWYLTDGNGITATPTIVTGADGYRYQELTLSGTASADATVRLSRPYVQNVAAGTFIGEAVIEMENLVNVGRIQVSLSNMPASGFNSGTKALFSFPSARMLFRTLPTAISNSGFVNKDNLVDILIPNGATVSGKIRIGRVGVHRVG